MSEPEGRSFAWENTFDLENSFVGRKNYPLLGYKAQAAFKIRFLLLVLNGWCLTHFLPVES
jgi:hypothetical protein